jgi:hypothetical protein
MQSLQDCPQNRLREYIQGEEEFSVFSLEPQNDLIRKNFAPVLRILQRASPFKVSGITRP